MSRPKEGRIKFTTRLLPEDLEKLSEIVRSLGYTYGKDSPAWGEWMEAIVRGDILLYKKIDNPLDDRE